MLNEIGAATIFGELSEEQQGELGFILARLRLECQPTCRIAPSIIIRSELQIFGCSSPRFAYRIYFKSGTGFLNIRRFRLLKMGVRTRQVKDDTSHLMLDEVGENEIRGILQDESQSCIADCLLPVPPEYREFHLLTAILSDAYGETLPKESGPYAGTPFLKNVILGGGLCAQACCFMATAILHAHATGVHGLGEITALANSPRRRILSISDMNYPLMANYFAAVALIMTEQNTHTHIHRGDLSLQEVELMEFVQALKSYLLSGMPVVVPLDTGKLLGFHSLNKHATRDLERSIYYKNGLDIDPEDLEGFDHTEPNNHCVILVGCQTSANPNRSKFLFNDPSYYPFMEATASDLLDACPYAAASPHAARGSFWSVTPDAVKMPLLDFKPLGSIEYLPGLKSISRMHRYSSLRHDPNQTSHFLLAQLDGLATTRYLDPLTTRTYQFPRVWPTMRERLEKISSTLKEKLYWRGKHWVWLEIMQDSVWMWDAEIEPVLGNSNEYLIAYAVLNGNQIEIKWPNEFELGD